MTFLLRGHLTRCGALAVCCALSFGTQKPGPQRVRIAPQFTVGSVHRYQMQFRTITDARRTGVVEDPQAAAQAEISWDTTVRVEVLSAEAAAKGGAPRARLRTTYEKSTAEVRTDAYDPAAAGLADQYRKLEGRAIEFTVEADGKISSVQGLEEILTDEKAASAAHEWLTQLALGASAPKEGIAPGHRWAAEHPATGAPLADVVWRTQSTYLRDEPCRLPTGVASGAEVLAKETCAVILTQLNVRQMRNSRDLTPEDYRKSGLRTSGTWSGTGESLSYVSLESGWVVSVTQSGSQEMDVTIANADGESKMRYAGHVRSQSQISLLPETPAAPR